MTLAAGDRIALTELAAPAPGRRLAVRPGPLLPLAGRAARGRRAGRGAAHRPAGRLGQRRPAAGGGARTGPGRLDDPGFAARITAAMDARGAFLGPGAGRGAGRAADHRAARRRRQLRGLRRRAAGRPAGRPRRGVRAAAGRRRRAHPARRPRPGRPHRRASPGTCSPTRCRPGSTCTCSPRCCTTGTATGCGTCCAASFAALPPGGWLLDHDTHVDADKRGPLPVAEYSVLLMHSTPGKCWSVGELTELAERLGFVAVEHRPTAGDRGVLLARKPETVLLFSYGTLRQPEVQRATFGRLLDGDADTIPGFELDMLTITDPAVIATSGSDRHPVLRRTDRPGAAVPRHRVPDHQRRAGRGRRVRGRRLCAGRGHPRLRPPGLGVRARDALTRRPDPDRRSAGPGSPAEHPPGPGLTDECALVVVRRAEYHHQGAFACSAGRSPSASHAESGAEIVEALLRCPFSRPGSGTRVCGRGPHRRGRTRGRRTRQRRPRRAPPAARPRRPRPR